MKSDLLRFSLSLLLCLGLASCGGGGSQQASIGATPPTPVVFPPLVNAGQLLPQPPGTIYFGSYVNASGLAGGVGPSSLANLESQMGRKLALDLEYQAFNARFTTHSLTDDFVNGRVPIDSWNCSASNAAVASGALDSTIVLQADSAKAYGWPIFIRYLWDMNLPSTSSYFSRTQCYDPATDNADKTFSAKQFIAAWQHIRQIFAQEGATNVVWLWSISSTGANTLAYYPGDTQVDWVGMDAYDLTNGSFSDTFATSYALLASLNKPIMITETGAGASVQPTFFTQGVQTLKSQFPLVKGFVYYDAIGNEQDWRIAPQAFPAFSSFVNDPYLMGAYAH